MGEADAADEATLREELRRVAVADIVFASGASFAQLAYVKLDPESRDLARRDSP